MEIFKILGYDWIQKVIFVITVLATIGGIFWIYPS